MASGLFSRQKPVSISLSPNMEKEDVFLALKLLFRPWQWKKGRGTAIFEEEIRKYLGVKYAFSFNSGRSSLLAILKSLELEPGSGVMLQAFTCNAAVNPVLWARLNPVYVDCDKETFNIDTADLKRKIASGANTLMVQHTFGLPAKMDEILEVATENNLIVIEDCAHALGSEYKGRKVGNFGRAAFFSFSRDKVISSVYGGAAVTNDEALAQKLKKFQEGVGYPSYFWIFQQILHPVLMEFVILPLYKFFSIGKALLILLQTLGILSKAVHKSEKKGEMPPYFPKRFPSALTLLALRQLKKIDRFHSHRKNLCDLYYRELKGSGFLVPEHFSKSSLEQGVSRHSFLRFTVKHKSAHKIIKKAWRKNILLGDWYTSPIAPRDTKLNKLKYEPGICPAAEEMAMVTMNLPTHINISKEKALEIANFVKNYGTFNLGDKK